jgi:hypothetical protein
MHPRCTRHIRPSIYMFSCVFAQLFFTLSSLDPRLGFDQTETRARLTDRLWRPLDRTQERWLTNHPGPQVSPGRNRSFETRRDEFGPVTSPHSAVPFRSTLSIAQCACRQCTVCRATAGTTDSGKDFFSLHVYRPTPFRVDCTVSKR